MKHKNICILFGLIWIMINATGCSLAPAGNPCQTNNDCGPLHCHEGKCANIPKKSISKIHRYISGSRIKARYLEGTDGTKQFIGWYDTEKKVNCTFRQASSYSLGALASKNYFCLPSTAQPTKPGNPPIKEVLYLDPQCTQPVLITFACNTPTTNLVLVPTHKTDKLPENPFERNICPFVPKVQKYTAHCIVKQIAVPDVAFSKSSDGKCAQSKGALLPEAIKPDSKYRDRIKIWQLTEQECKADKAFEGFVSAEVRLDQD